jgi:uncharacterized protein YkwD
MAAVARSQTDTRSASALPVPTVPTLRTPLALVTAVLAMVVLAVPAGQAAVVLDVPATQAVAISSMQRLERDILRQVTAVRRQYGLRPLRLSAGLTAAARSHSQEMGRLGYFSHYSADGTSAGSRIRRFYRDRGYRMWWVGENLFWSSTSVDARLVMQTWLASRSHRKELLSRRYREQGVSAVHVPGAPRAFGGRDATIVTINFGARSR